MNSRRGCTRKTVTFPRHAMELQRERSLLLVRVSRELISRLVVKLPIILIATLRRSDDKTFAMRDYAMRARVSLGKGRKRELHRTEVALTLVKRIVSPPSLPR